MTRDQRQHTKDPAVSAGHAADNTIQKVWDQTHDFDQALIAGNETFQGMLKENILDEFPGCPNKQCPCYGDSVRVGYSHIGFRYYCYECSETF